MIRGMMFRFVALVVLLALLTAAVAQENYAEAPQLAARVAAGELPPVEERLPSNPLVVVPHESIGEYGGDWRTALVGGADSAWIGRTIAYENLMRWNHMGTEVLPNIAASVEANEDATEYTFYLREGMRWSDGQPFTADDIMFWYEDIFLNSELTASQGSNPPTVEKVDDTTVRFSFAEPYGLFLQNIATLGGGFPYTSYPRHYLEQFHPTYNADGIDALVAAAGAQDWVTLFNQRAGEDTRFTNTELPTLYAWRLTQGYGDGTRVLYERNPYYWKVDPEGNQLPYLDRVVYQLIEDREVLLLRAMAGEIDMQDRHIGTTVNRPILFDNMERGDYRFFSATPDVGATCVVFLNLNHPDPVKREIFNNRDFRIGLSHAINRQEIVDLIFVGQTEPFQIAPRPESRLYDEEMAKQYTEYNVELANEYLDRAGYTERDSEGYRLGPDGNRISFAVEIVTVATEFINCMELYSQHWQEVGIEAQVRPIDRSLWTVRHESAQHDALIHSGEGGLDPIVRPDRFFPGTVGSLYAPKWGAWYVNPEDPFAEEPPAPIQRLMELYRQIEQTADPERQDELMREMLEINKEEFYLIGGVLAVQGYGIVRNNFRNVPEIFAGGFTQAGPANTNPEQYFIRRDQP